jgi:hypothetical protein
VRLGNLEAKHQKLAVDPGCPPQRIFPAHPLDEITQTDFIMILNKLWLVFNRRRCQWSDAPSGVRRHYPF